MGVIAAYLGLVVRRILAASWMALVGGAALIVVLVTALVIGFGRAGSPNGRLAFGSGAPSIILPGGGSQPGSSVQAGSPGSSPSTTAAAARSAGQSPTTTSPNPLVVAYLDALAAANTPSSGPTPTTASAATSTGGKKGSGSRSGSGTTYSSGTGRNGSAPVASGPTSGGTTTTTQTTSTTSPPPSSTTSTTYYSPSYPANSGSGGTTTSTTPTTTTSPPSVPSGYHAVGMAVSYTHLTLP